MGKRRKGKPPELVRDADYARRRARRIQVKSILHGKRMR